MRAVISDASPLIFLAKLGHLDWLGLIYGKVVIPKTVWVEVASDESPFPDSRVIQQAIHGGWLEVAAPAGRVPAAALQLDPGEREAIALAKEMEALLIIDDMAGRLVAQRLGLDVTGTAGVLLAAKLRGLTPSLKRELDRLQRDSTFWLSNELRADLLRHASEPE